MAARQLGLGMLEPVAHARRVHAALHPQDQVRQLDRLDDVVRRAGAHGVDRARDVTVRRDHDDDRWTGSALFSSPSRDSPSPSGKPAIEDHQLGRRRLDRLARLVQGVREHDRESLALAAPRPPATRTRGRRRPAASGRFMHSASPRQADREAAAVRAALERERAALLLHRPACHGEPETDALGLRRSRRARSRRASTSAGGPPALSSTRTYAWPSCRPAETRTAGCVHGAEILGDHRRLDRVAHQVVERRRHQQRVAGDADGLGQVGREPHLVELRQHAQAVDGFAGQLVQPARSPRAAAPASRSAAARWRGVPAGRSARGWCAWRARRAVRRRAARSPPSAR